MASTYSTRLKLELMATGEKSGTWGTITNNNLGSLLEEAITGIGYVSFADANITLTIPNGATATGRHAVLLVSGTNSAVRNLFIPAAQKVYTVWNYTTGGFAINVTCGGASYAVIPNGYAAVVICDGTGVFQLSAAFSPGSNTIAANISGTFFPVGDLILAKTNAAMFLQKGGSGEASTVWGTTTGTAPRWTMTLGDTSAEVGGNSGSNFAITAWSDAGAATTALSITRATNNVYATNDIHDRIGNVRNRAMNILGGAYTLQAGDGGKCFTFNAGDTGVPANTLSSGDEILVFNNGAAPMNIYEGVGLVLQWAGGTTTGGRVLGVKGLATILCITPNYCVISGAGLT